MSAWLNHPGGYVFKDAGKMPRFWILPDKPMWYVKMEPDSPLTFRADGEEEIRVGNEFLTDLGSIPFFLHPVFPPAYFRASYVFHDWACVSGGFYLRYGPIGDFVFHKMSRRVIDKYLKQMIQAEGGTWFQRWAIYGGVRLGWYSWIRRSWHPVPPKIKVLSGSV